MEIQIGHVFAGMMLLVSAAVPAQGDGNRERAQRVASAYLDAMEASDLDAAESLFATHSFIFETGGTEGSWEQYRQHHLGPEMGSVSSFSTEREEPHTFASEDGTMVTVAWPLEYRIVLADEREIHSKGTITFVLTRESDSFRILHLHWSSRRVQQSH